jgi:hypothetical protein
VSEVVAGRGTIAAASVATSVIVGLNLILVLQMFGAPLGGITAPK